jgi:prepilin-type N-terminal cleavage/methylation domain-containing protein
MNATRQSGFSLVELSIVLIILGLLTGGILGGQSLIKAAEMRSVSTEFEQWQTAANTFKERYFSLPGDFNKATMFWTEAANDGNQDGVITLGDDPSMDRELFLFWQHLALAGMISGEYTGVQGPLNTFHAIPGENIPKARYSGGAWTATTREGGSGARYDLPYNNIFIFGAASASSLAHNQLLLPEQAWQMDVKFDDGMPGKGRVIAYWWDDCTDSTSNTDYDGDYALSVQTVACALIFRSSI